MQLGLRAELAGDYPLAETSLLAAAARSRLYQPKYLLAQYYFRRQNAARFWPWARAALEAAYGDAAPVFELGWRLRPDATWLSANLIPPRREMARQYLAYLCNRERWAAAAAEARKMVPAAEPLAGAATQRDTASGRTGLGQGRVRTGRSCWPIARRASPGRCARGSEECPLPRPPAGARSVGPGPVAAW